MPSIIKLNQLLKTAKNMKPKGEATTTVTSPNQYNS